MTPRKQIYDIALKDIATFKRCRQLWNYTASTRMHLAPTTVHVPFYLHDLVRNGLLHSDWYPTALLPQDQSSATIDLARSMLEHYRLWQQYALGATTDREFTRVATDVKFTSELWHNTRRAVNITGVYDAIVRHNITGRYYIWDLRTTSRIIERKKQLSMSAVLDTQLLLANDVFKQLGIDNVCSGIIVTLLRKKAPTQPTILKDGSLSRNKSIDTSSECYAQCIRSQHPNDPMSELIVYYGTILHHLQTQATPFFDRFTIQRSDLELKQAKNDLLAVIGELIDRNVAIYPTDNDRCSSCLFYTPCSFYRRGELTTEATHLAYNFIRGTL